MLKLNPILLSVVALLVASLACAAPGIPTPDSNVIGTMVVQTIVAGLTQTSEAFIPITGLGSPTSTPTPEPPTLTPTATLSPTPIFTATPLVPQVSVSVATNCRVGPGKVYDRVGALLVGEVAEVVGRDSTGAYWLIRNPDSDSGFCWLWGEYATLTGNYVALPVFTPPPTPTPMPAFDASYDGLENCNTNWWVDLRLKNTGGIDFRSVSITLRDTVTATVVSMSSDGFTDNDGCLGSSTRDTLSPGGDRVVSAPVFAYDPSGHRIRASITVCSNKGLNGTCVTQELTLKP